MLGCPEAVADGQRQICGHVEAKNQWTPFPSRPMLRQFRLFLGDPESGPAVYLLSVDPVETPEGQPRPEHAGAPVHLHRAPSFRVMLGDQPRQQLIDGEWFGPGDYFLLEANKKYHDPFGIDGAVYFLVFADRRGIHPAYDNRKVDPSRPDTSLMTSDELIAWNSLMYGDLGGNVLSMHTRNEQATRGAALSTGTDLGRGGRARGSIFDQSGWTALKDGSAIASVFMGDPISGPAVIMSKNPPYAVESPSGFCGTDMFRLIVKGSCSIGQRSFDAGSFVASEAGSALDEVVHGPEGSTQLLVLADRRRLAPLDATGGSVRSPRCAELSEVLAPFMQTYSAKAASQATAPLH